MLSLNRQMRLAFQEPKPKKKKVEKELPKKAETKDKDKDKGKDKDKDKGKAAKSQEEKGPNGELMFQVGQSERYLQGCFSGILLISFSGKSEVPFQGTRIRSVKKTCTM